MKTRCMELNEMMVVVRDDWSLRDLEHVVGLMNSDKEGGQCDLLLERQWLALYLGWKRT